MDWINDPENNRYLHYDLPLEYEKTLRWFHEKDNSRRIDCVIEFCGCPVGVIGLLNIDRFDKKAEFYITIGDHRFKQKGIATESSRMILDYAFEQLLLHKVYLNVDEENVIACKLYEKIGFLREGIFIDDMVHRGKFINRLRYAIFDN